jgi:DEAD/DEAH box helicase domain-containing protein
MISTWQQAGRSGRGKEDSLVVLIGRQNPLDQYFLNHPEEFFNRDPEFAIIDLHNQYILWGHLLCAAKELPLTKEDSIHFGNYFLHELLYLTNEGLLKSNGKRWFYRLLEEPFKKVAINNIGSDRFFMYSETGLIETLDREQAYKEAFEGSIYIHQGETYIVQKMDLSNNTITVKKENTQFNTEPQIHIDVSVVQAIETKSFHYFNLTFGKVNVTEEYYSYRIKRRSAILNEFPLNLPPIKFDTTSFWIDIPANFQAELLAKYDSKKLQGGIHGVEHAIIAMMPLHVLCDRKDLGGLSTLFDPQTCCARIFVYDGFLGGIGLCEKGYSIISNLLKSALDLVEGCKCNAIDGCPACIHSPKCGNDNQTLDKEMTIKLLKSLL